MSFIRDYFELVKQHEVEYGNKNTIVLIQNGDFFEVYGLLKLGVITGSNIVKYAEICDLHIGEKKNVMIDDYKVVMTGFKHYYFEKYIKKLQSNGYITAVYMQDEPGKGSTRSKFGIFSPGTTFVEDNEVLSNVTMCVWVENYTDVFMKSKCVTIGISCVDVCTGRTSMLEYEEVLLGSMSVYDMLEKQLLVYNPSECIIISNQSNWDTIIKQSGMKQSICVHKLDCTSNKVLNCEKQVYQKEILEKFYGNKEIDDSNQIAIQSLCYLLNFIYEHSPQLISNIEPPIIEEINVMTLANHSLKQLNIIDDGDEISVVKLLNKCVTPMGKRYYVNMITHPIWDEEKLQKEYDVIECVLKRDFVMELSLLSKISDLNKLQRMLVMERLECKHLLQLDVSLKALSDVFELDESWLSDYLLGYGVDMGVVSKGCVMMSEFLESHFVLDKLTDGLTEDVLCKGVNKELDSAIETIKIIGLKIEAIRKHLNDYFNTQHDYVKNIETESSYLLICTASRSTVLKKQLLSTSHNVSLCYFGGTFELSVGVKDFSFVKQSGNNVSIHHELLDSLCNEYISLKNAMKPLLKRVFLNIIVEMGVNFQDILSKCCHVIMLIDVLFSKAKVAREFGYTKPIINKDHHTSMVNATGLRHCLVEHFSKNELYVTNNISLSSQGILLYGTNAVGKTTFIKSIGIAIILAQSGQFVPATNFQYKPFKSIYTRILGNDNIFKGMSTFEVEMTELRNILHKANQHSLILGDELCSGTETISAISIFVAGIHYLSKCNSNFIFATHLHEIIHYDEITQLPNISIQHMSVQYNKELGQLVYDRKLKPGSGANVYGLEVCKSMHLPPEFLEFAENIRTKYNLEFQPLLSLKPSKYNSHKLINMCEICNTHKATEIHHLQFQQHANTQGIIHNDNDLSTFHKNHLANLIAICNYCHDNIHTHQQSMKKRKTDQGTILIPSNT